MSEIGMERRTNELRNCTEEELLHILSTVDTHVLLKAIENEISRLKTLEADMLRLFQKQEKDKWQIQEER